MSASRSGQARREKFRDERELVKDFHNSMVVFADVRDAVRWLQAVSSSQAMR